MTKKINLQHLCSRALGPTVGQVLGDMMGTIDHYIALKRPEEAALVACWVIGTYFFPLFPAFPRLNLHGERGSGKSKLLEVISRLAFNGLWRVSPTPASLFRLIGPLRPTFCLDEMEGLVRSDRDAILNIINAGYKNGGAVDRVEGDSNNRHIVTFPVYAPIALAGIQGLNPTTTDRCITLTMERRRDGDKLNRHLPLDDAPFAKLRSWCYRLALTEFQVVQDTWEKFDFPAWLEARHRELYAPLLTLAALADRDADLGLTEGILNLAQADLCERGGVSQDGEALFHILSELLGAAPSIIVRPKDLAGKLSPWLDRRVTAEEAGRLLRRYGFRSSGRRDSLGVLYPITREELAKVMAMYNYEVS